MMQLSKDVIVDLLPAYLSDEVSDETRALVDAAAARDPAIARLIAAARAQQFDPPHIRLSQDLEMRAVRRTRSRLRRQTWTLALAVVFSLLPLTFVFRAGEVTFDLPKQAMLLWVVAAAMWLEYYVLGREDGRRTLTEWLKGIWRKQIPK